MKTIAIAAAGLIAATSGVSFLTPGSAEAQARGYQNQAQSRGAPRGSYSQSCTNAYVNQGRLYADCRDRSGQTRSTSIQLSRCASSDIGNDNGLLTCYNHRGSFENSRPGRPGDDSHRPDRPGSRDNDAITVYRDSHYRGQSMTFRNQVSNLRSSGLNDAISSIRLGRGDWEVCTDADFRGDCRVIRSDQTDLSRAGLNDKISSLRPARRGYR